MNEEKNINDMSSEELGLLLGQQVQLYWQTQNNINLITTELNKRKDVKKE